MSRHAGTAEGLVHKVNQIARYFGSQPHIDKVEAISDHIRKFWEPRMRAQALDWLDAGGEGMEPLAKEALERLRPLG